MKTTKRKRAFKQSDAETVHWQSVNIVTYFAGAISNGLALSIIVMREEFGMSPGWGAIALVTPAKPGGLDEVLGNHDHKILARAVRRAEAKRIAVKEISAFLAKKPKRNRCACKEAA